MQLGSDVAVAVVQTAAAVPIRPLAWELPYVTGAAKKKEKKKNSILYTATSVKKKEEEEKKRQSSFVVQRVKDLVGLWLQLWRGFDPSPGNFCRHTTIHLLTST